MLYLHYSNGSSKTSDKKFITEVAFSFGVIEKLAEVSTISMKHNLSIYADINSWIY